MRAGKAIGVAGLGVLALLGVLGAGSCVMLGTDAGLNVVRGALVANVPGIKLESLTGSVFALRAKGFAYEAPGLSVAGDFSWDMAAADLLRGRLTIADLTLSQGRVHVRSSEMPATAPASASAEARLTAPLPLTLEQLAIKDLRADVDGHVVDLKSLSLQAVWANERVTVNTLALDGVKVQTAPTPPSDESPGVTLQKTFAAPLLPDLPAIAVPVDLALESFALTHFTLGSDRDPTVDSLTFALSIENGRASVKNLALKTPQGDLTGDLSLSLDAAHDLEGKLSLSALVPRESIPTGVAAEPEAPTTQQVENFYARLRKARAEQLAAAKERRAKRLAQETHKPVVVETKDLTRQKRLAQARERRERIARGLERWRRSVRGMLPKREPQPPVKVTLNLELQGTLTDQVTLTGTVANVPGVADASVSIVTEPTKAGLPFEAGVRAHEVLIGGATLENACLSWKGKATDYTLDGALTARYPIDAQKTLAVDLRLAGTGSETQAHLRDLSLVSEVGRLQIDGEVNWAKDLFFSAALRLDDVDTRSLAPTAPLTLTGGLSVWGTQTEGGWTSRLQDLTLLGELRGEALSVTGAAASNGKGLIEIPSLYVTVGNNSLEISGQIDAAPEVPTLDIQAKIDAPKLSLVDPNLKGLVKGAMHVTGTSKLPVVNADITARGIGYLDTTIESARLTGRMRSRETVSGNLTLQIKNLSAAGATVQEGTVQLRGNELDHRLTLKTQGKPVSLDATVTGLYERMLGNWSGRLASLNVLTDHGTVALEKPMRLSYVPALKRFNVAAACLTHPSAKLCLKDNLPVDLSLQSPLRVRVSLEKFDTAFVSDVSEGVVRSTGLVTGSLDMTVPAGMTELPTGKIRLESKNLSAIYRTAMNDLRLDFNTLELTFANTRDSISARWLVDIKDNGDITGDVLVKDIFATRALNGTLTLTDIDAGLVNSFLSPGETAKGTIYGDLHWAGTLDEPKVFGKAGIRQARIDSTKLPFEMQPSDAKIVFDGNRSTLEALLKTPKGEIRFEGKADWRTLSEGRAVLTAKGADLRVTLPPDIEADVTTDVVCEASADLIKLDGYVAIPKARVTVSELPDSVVEPSEDVVRLDRPRRKKAARGDPIAVQSNLKIHIGDNVRVEAMGLKARLTGSLTVVQDKNTMGLTGYITVPTGSFKAYGQDLIVRRGEFHFVGAAANPLIDLEAVRNPDRTADDVTAGIRVTGSAEAPQVTVFSDPAKSETEALSYLIRGEGLDPSGDSDNTMITSALINLGLSQGAQTFRSLGDAVGISGLGLDTEGVGDSSQLVISGYVLPGLKVKYGVGIFDSLATLTLRYRVIPKLYIEAVSGIDQALDVLYAFEF